MLRDFKLKPFYKAKFGYLHINILSTAVFYVQLRRFDKTLSLLLVTFHNHLCSDNISSLYCVVIISIFWHICEKLPMLLVFGGVTTITSKL